jgi:hypothetical protein
MQHSLFLIRKILKVPKQSTNSKGVDKIMILEVWSDEGWRLDTRKLFERWLN